LNYIVIKFKVERICTRSVLKVAVILKIHIYIMVMHLNNMKINKTQ